MFLAARSARAANGDGSRTSSRLPKATFRPDGFQNLVLIKAEATIITHVSSVEATRIWTSVPSPAVIWTPTQCSRRGRSARVGWKACADDYGEATLRFR